MRLRVMAASALAVGALVSACQTNGDSGGGSTTPAAPSSTTSTTTSASAPATTSAPSPTAAPAEVLAPQNGMVFVATRSGKTRCQLSTTEVDCEAPFTAPPQVDGEPANGVRTTATGEHQYVVGNLGNIPVTTIDYRSYSAVGWTILASEDGTRFTNDATGRGMFVAVEKVDFF